MRTVALILAAIVTALLTVAMLFTAGWTRPPILGQQIGYRGVGMEQITTPAAQRRLELTNSLPDPIAPASPTGDRAVDVYKNVQVLTDLSADQFNRVMSAITQWVAPQQGCTYCHNAENLADDSLYTKVVSRRMLQMTRHINTDEQAHVGTTGVVCYTCHRGNPVPAYVFYNDTGWPQAGGFATTNHGMGHPAAANGSTALTQDPYPALLEKNDVIRVQATQALPKEGMGASIQSTERTYALMIAISKGLGVNCTFCHNSREFGQWPESTPQRVTAWHGIQLTQDLDNAYLDPLKNTLPANRLGPHGDAPKVDCATCHQGASKPLLGASIAKDFPELGGVASP
jgi:photosynthetic reaction center cytochrome c subunit